MVRAHSTPTSAIVVHDLGHVEAALTAAVETKTPVMLLSAPGAAAYLGVELFATMIALGRESVPHARSLAVLECGSDAGKALEAIRRGLDAIRVKTQAKAQAQLEELAKKAGVRVITGKHIALDLHGQADPLNACRTHLGAAITRSTHSRQSLQSRKKARSRP